MYSASMIMMYEQQVLILFRCCWQRDFWALVLVGKTLQSCEGTANAWKWVRQKGRVCPEFVNHSSIFHVTLQQTKMPGNRNPPFFNDDFFTSSNISLPKGVSSDVHDMNDSRHLSCNCPPIFTIPKKWILVSRILTLW